MVFGKKPSIKDTSFSILNGEKTEEMSKFVLIFSRETSFKTGTEKCHQAPSKSIMICSKRFTKKIRSIKILRILLR